MLTEIPFRSFFVEWFSFLELKDRETLEAQEKMAPIYAAAVGVSPQLVDDDRLRELRSSLEAVEMQIPLHRRAYKTPEEVEKPLDIERLVSLLEAWQSWVFEEQVRSTFDFSFSFFVFICNSQ